MRREKKRSTACGSPNWNVAAFSRKKLRFSGKNRSKRVRFTCSSSASTWEKSVLTVKSVVTFGVMPHFTSNPAVALASRVVLPPRRSSLLVATP